MTKTWKCTLTAVIRVVDPTQWDVRALTDEMLADPHVTASTVELVPAEPALDVEQAREVLEHARVHFLHLLHDANGFPDNERHDTAMALHGVACVLAGEDPGPDNS